MFIISAFLMQKIVSSMGFGKVQTNPSCVSLLEEIFFF